MQEISNIDNFLLKNSFNEKWINDIKNIVDDYVKNSQGIINRQYFNELGSYANRNDDTVDISLSNYFNRLLYAPNFAILDYVLKNKSKFKDLKFIDNGAGLGILSIFLKKLGIDCYNYDNFTQIKDVTFNKDVLNNLKINIRPITNIIENDCDVLVCSGIWVDNPKFLELNLKYLLLDRNHLEKGIGKELTSKFKLLETYNTICVYGK